ncbi:hypothetical protein, partial [Paludisphaera soli]|uniref:hypothetical protein n=1 Tax=Paludisphaera soli TaxID=2712865 RepID=UPI0019821473
MSILGCGPPTSRGHHVFTLRCWQEAYWDENIVYEIARKQGRRDRIPREIEDWQAAVQILSARNLVSAGVLNGLL